MKLDHVFVFIDPDGPEPATLAALGLNESFRRAHPGQGTANACYCFDNAYLELLWLTDAAEAGGAAAARLQLAARAGWRRNGASPFGIALRGGEARGALPFPTWDYRPSYLPDGQSVPVAIFSDDPAQPLVFRSPGDSRPDAWPPERWPGARVGARQTAAGLTEIVEVTLGLPQAPHPALQALASGWLKIETTAAPQIVLGLSRAQGTPLRLLLPDCRLL